MKIDGQCHCGAIAYEAEVDPAKVGICHCADCQALSASAFRTVAMVPADQFTILRGTPREYVKVADSGNRRVQGFCADCGSGLYATEDADPRRTYNIRLGTARQRHELRPRFEVWRRSALPWVAGLEGTAKFDRGPR